MAFFGNAWTNSMLRMVDVGHRVDHGYPIALDGRDRLLGSEAPLADDVARATNAVFIIAFWPKTWNSGGNWREQHPRSSDDLPSTCVAASVFEITSP